MNLDCETKTTLQSVVAGTFDSTGVKWVDQIYMNYAEFKLKAMTARENGQIQEALKLEARCDRIYDSLPAWAQW